MRTWNRSWLALLVLVPWGCGGRLDSSGSGDPSEDALEPDGAQPPVVSPGSSETSTSVAFTDAGGMPEAGRDAAISRLDATDGRDAAVTSTTTGVDATVRDASETCGGELHVVSLYQGAATGSDVSVAYVHVERPGSHVLVLSAYDPVRWVVSSEPAATLERVIVNGYELQEAVIPEGVAVEFHDGPSQNLLFDPAHTWSMAWGLGNSSAPIAVVEGDAARPLTTFSGCYAASSITLHADSSISIDCDEGRASVHVNQACEASSVEFLNTDTSSENVDFIPESSAEAWCWMLQPKGDGSVALQQIDPQVGSFFEVATFTSPDQELPSSFHTDGLALLDGRLIFAGYMENNQQWAQIDLGAEVVTIGGNSNYVTSVASNGTELIAPCGPYQEELCTFDGFLALAQERPVRRMQTGTLQGTSFTAHDDRVYSARFSGAEVFVHDPQTGTVVSTIALDGFDDWNKGIALTSDRLYLAAGGSTESPACIVTFDPETGTQLNQVCVAAEPSPEWSGLWCDGAARQ